MANKIPLFILVGPTAIGKTKISIDIAKKLNGEIISADSMQIYKFMDIGTAKIKEEEKEGIPHYMIDIVYPDEEFTVANYKAEAKKHIKKIYNRGKLPMLVGGSGLYVNSLIYKLNFIQVPPNYDFRKKHSLLADEYGNKYIHDKLRKVDSISANRIHKNDRKRVIRALEIYHETGKPMTTFYKNFRKPNESYDVVVIGLTMDREELYSRINKRVEFMIEEGLVEEVKGLLKKGYDKNLNSMKAIGYEEIIQYLDGNFTLDDAINQIKQNSRRFAKRQLTWFRRNDSIKWVNIDKFNDIIDLNEYIISYTNKALK